MLKKAEKLEILATYSATQGIKVTAGIVQDNLSDMFRKRIVERKDSSFLYFIARAVTADVPNKNHDLFPLDEIKEHYMTFVDRCLFLDHNAKKVENAVGKVVAAELRTDDSGETYVACLCRVDRWLQPHICRMIEAGTINSVSMGANVGWAECSQCGCKATKESEFCEHMKAPNLYNSHSINHDVEFTELSLVSVPADPSAKMSKVFDLHHDLTKTADAVQGKDPMAQAQNPAISPDQEQATPQEETVVDFGDDVQNPLYQIDCSSNETADHIFNVLHSGLNKGIEELTIAGKTIKLKMEPEIENHFEFLRDLLANADMFFGKGTMTEDDVLAVQSAVSPLLQKLAGKATQTDTKEWKLTVGDDTATLTMTTYLKGRSSSPLFSFNIAGKANQAKKLYEKVNTIINKAAAGYFTLTDLQKANHKVTAEQLTHANYSGMRDEENRDNYSSRLKNLTDELSVALDHEFKAAGYIQGDASNGEQATQKDIYTLYEDYLDATDDNRAAIITQIVEAYKKLSPEEQAAFAQDLGTNDTAIKEALPKTEEKTEAPKEEVKEEPKEEEKPEQPKEEVPAEQHSPRATSLIAAINTHDKDNKDAYTALIKAFDDNQSQEVIVNEINKLISGGTHSLGMVKYLGGLRTQIEGSKVQDAATKAYNDLKQSPDTDKTAPETPKPQTKDDTKNTTPEQPATPTPAPAEQQQQQQQQQQQPPAQQQQTATPNTAVGASFTAEGLYFTLSEVEGVVDLGPSPFKAKPLYNKTKDKYGNEIFRLNKAYNKAIIKMLADNTDYNIDLGMGANVPFQQANTNEPVIFKFDINDKTNDALYYILKVQYRPGQDFIFDLFNRTKNTAFKGNPPTKNSRDREGLTAKSFRAVIHMTVYNIYKDFNLSDDSKTASADLLTAITNAKLEPQLNSITELEGEIPCTLTVLDKTFNDPALTLTYKVTDTKAGVLSVGFKDPESGKVDTRTYVFTNGDAPALFERDLYDHYLNIGKYIIQLYFKEKDNGNKANGTK